MLTKPNCNKFIQGVLGEFNGLPNGVFSTDLMEIFEAVKGQKEGGLFRDPNIKPHFGFLILTAQNPDHSSRQFPDSLFQYLKNLLC